MDEEENQREGESRRISEGDARRHQQRQLAAILLKTTAVAHFVDFIESGVFFVRFS